MVLLHDCKRQAEGRGDARLAAHSTDHACGQQHKGAGCACALAAHALCGRLASLLHAQAAPPGTCCVELLM